LLFDEVKSGREGSGLAVPVALPTAETLILAK
jgi:hypothetical protein